MTRSYPTISDDPQVQARYHAMRAKGESHNMAKMLAERRLPGCVTDRELFRGKGNLDKQFRGEEGVLEQLVQTAARKGRKPHYTDFYEPSLAAYPGDPEAFVPASGGRNHVQKVLKKRGWASDGIVKTKASGPTTEELRELQSKKLRKKEKVHGA